MRRVRVRVSRPRLCQELLALTRRRVAIRTAAIRFLFLVRQLDNVSGYDDASVYNAVTSIVRFFACRANQDQVGRTKLDEPGDDKDAEGDELDLRGVVAELDDVGVRGAVDAVLDEVVLVFPEKRDDVEDARRE